METTSIGATFFYNTRRNFERINIYEQKQIDMDIRSNRNIRRFCESSKIFQSKITCLNIFFGPPPKFVPLCTSTMYLYGSLPTRKKNSAQLEEENSCLKGPRNILCRYLHDGNLLRVLPTFFMIDQLRRQVHIN